MTLTERSRVMARTVVSLFDNSNEAQQVVDDLARIGVPRSDISIARSKITAGATSTADDADNDIGAGLATTATTSAVVRGAPGPRDTMWGAPNAPKARPTLTPSAPSASPSPKNRPSSSRRSSSTTAAGNVNNPASKPASSATKISATTTTPPMPRPA